MTDIDIFTEPPLKDGDTPPLGSDPVNGYSNGAGDTQDLLQVVDGEIRIDPKTRINVKVIVDEGETDQMYNMFFNGFGESGFMVTHGDRYEIDGSPSNQDVVGFSDSVIVGGDGISGHRDGLTASRLATSTAASMMEYDNSEYGLFRAILRAQWEVSRLKQAWETHPPGTTLAGFRRTVSDSPPGFVDIEGINIGDTKLYAIIPGEDGNWSIERLGNSHGVDGYIYEDARFYAEFFQHCPQNTLFDFTSGTARSFFPEPVINSEFNINLSKDNYLNAIGGMRDALRTTNDDDRRARVRMVIGDLLVDQLQTIRGIDIGQLELKQFINYVAECFDQDEATTDSDINFLRDHEKMFTLFRIVHFARLNGIVESIGSMRDRVGGEGMHNFVFNFDEPNFEVAGWIEKVRDKFTFKKRLPVGTKVLIMSDGGDEIRTDRLLEIVSKNTPQRAARAIYEEFQATGKSTVIGNDNLFCTVTELQQRPYESYLDFLFRIVSGILELQMVDKTDA